MSKKKQITEIKEEILNRETEEPIKEQMEEPAQNNSSTPIENSFDKFIKTTSEFSPEEESEGTVIQNEEVKGEVKKELSFEEKAKVRIFLGFFLYVIEGVATMILNMVCNSKVPTDKMRLTDDEKLSIIPYLENEEFIKFLNKLPTWLIGSVHVGSMFMFKHNAIYKEYKLPPKRKIKKEEGATND